jgi:hypothetical protein
VENIPPQAERHSARRQELFAFPPESAFTFRPECCSESQRDSGLNPNTILLEAQLSKRASEVKSNLKVFGAQDG